MTNADVLITQPMRVADVGNEYLYSVLSPAENDIPGLDDSLFDNSFISAEGLFSLLLNLEEKYGGVTDNVSNPFLHRYAELMLHVFATIFCSCLKMAAIPDDWGIARVVAVHKKAELDD